MRKHFVNLTEEVAGKVHRNCIALVAVAVDQAFVGNSGILVVDDMEVRPDKVAHRDIDSLAVEGNWAGNLVAVTVDDSMLAGSGKAVAEKRRQEKLPPMLAPLVGCQHFQSQPVEDSNLDCK